MFGTGEITIVAEEGDRAGRERPTGLVSALFALHLPGVV
jgi:hypothetical protein